MRIENLIELTKKVSHVYGHVNSMGSHKSIEMIELAYPNQDGVQDDEVISEMFRLRANARMLSMACDILVKNLTVILGDFE